MPQQHPQPPESGPTPYNGAGGEVLPMVTDRFTNQTASILTAVATSEESAPANDTDPAADTAGRHRNANNRSRRVAGLALTLIAAGSLAASAPRSDGDAAVEKRLVAASTSADHYSRVPMLDSTNLAEAPTDVKTPYGAADWHAEVGPEQTPQLFDRRELPNAIDIGAIEIVYNPANDAKRDKLWGSIDEYWASQGKTFKNGAKHPAPGTSLVHPLVSDIFNPSKPLPKAYQGLSTKALDHKILGNGFVMDNQPGSNPFTKNPNIMVVAGHNVTPVPTVMQIGNGVYKNSRMGINAPLVNGDQAKIYVPDSEQKGVAKIYTFTLRKQFVTPMSDPNGYNDLYKLKATPDKPLLVMYHCTPDGDATERHVAVYEWEDTSYQNMVLKRIK